jgi:hypothetical protein
MRSFVIAWVVAFGLVAVGASAVSWFVGKAPQPPAPDPNPPRRPQFSQEAGARSSGPFTQAEAIDVVALRLPTDPSGRSLRQELQTKAVVTYHSPQHWRVCLDTACWVAHGPGRYAEPENDEALQRERTGTTAP